MKVVIAMAAAICFVCLVLQTVAFGQLTGERRLKGTRYVALAFLTAWFLIDWLLGATGWVLIEGIALIVRFLLRSLTSRFCWLKNRDKAEFGFS